MEVELDGAPQRSPRHDILKRPTQYASNQYSRQAIQPSCTVVKHRAISAERGRGVPGHLSRPYRRSFAVGAFVQEGDPRNPLADAAQPGDTMWSI
jgi:hypothetical protein